MRRDYYAVLGVSASATAREIRQAFRRLARQDCPDVNLWDPQAAARFEEIVEAYRVLSDPAARAAYDRDGGGEAAERSRAGVVHGSGGRVPGDVLHVVLDLSFADAVRGSTVEVEVLRRSPCPSCKATGDRRGTPPQPCEVCGGTGVRWRGGGPAALEECGRCEGLGVRVADACPNCRGGGVVPIRAAVPVRIPPGVDTGTQLRVTGQGHAGPLGGPRADLIVSTRVASHPGFARKGDSLYCEAVVTISQAALGARIAVPTLEGTAMMAIPPGTQSGQRFRLRGKGVPRLAGQGRGDLYVTCRVEIPRELDPRTEAVFRELAREDGRT